MRRTIAVLGIFTMFVVGRLAAQGQGPNPVGVYDVGITTSDGQKIDARIMVKGEPGKYEGTFTFPGMEDALPLDTIRVVGNEIQIGFSLPAGNGHRFFNLTPVTADSLVGKSSGGPRSADLVAKRVR
jgi:hypothetical protein